MPGALAESFMSLATRITSLAQSIASETRSIRRSVFGGETASASWLDTDAKNVVGAINEVRRAVIPTIEIAANGSHAVLWAPAIVLCDVSSGPVVISIPASGRVSLIITGGDPSISNVTLTNSSAKFNGQPGPYVISSAAFARYDFEFINATYGFSIIRNA
jgi:hypothetical protein